MDQPVTALAGPEELPKPLDAALKSKEFKGTEMLSCYTILRKLEQIPTTEYPGIVSLLSTKYLYSPLVPSKIPPAQLFKDLPSLIHRVKAVCWDTLLDMTNTIVDPDGIIPIGDTFLYLYERANKAELKAALTPADVQGFCRLNSPLHPRPAG